MAPFDLLRAKWRNVMTAARHSTSFWCSSMPHRHLSTSGHRSPWWQLFASSACPFAQAPGARDSIPGPGVGCPPTGAPGAKDGTTQRPRLGACDLGPKFSTKLLVQSVFERDWKPTN